MQVISEEKFSVIMQEKLGKHYGRALEVFQNYSPNLSFDVTNILFHAAEQEKVEEVLVELEKHYEHSLKYQHPEIRGIIHGYRTQLVFNQLCTVTLGLQPNPE